MLVLTLSGASATFHGPQSAQLRGSNWTTMSAIFLDLGDLAARFGRPRTAWKRPDFGRLGSERSTPTRCLLLPRSLVLAALLVTAAVSTVALAPSRS
ncbi:MAG: hypothetical protein M3308_02900, partial [Actinomycetota bacterium]|nr:hypothetical protein [Actinomycetota bacterium]